MIGNRLLGLRGRAEGLFKLGLLTPPVGVSVSGGGGGATPTVTSLTASSVYTNDVANFGILRARDGSNATDYHSDGSDAPWTLIIQLSAPAKLRWIAQIYRGSTPNNGMGLCTIDYSDNGGSTWTAGTGGTPAGAGVTAIAANGMAFASWAVGATGGAQEAIIPNDDGSHATWRINCLRNIQNDALNGTVGRYVNFSEIKFATDTAGTSLMVGP